jgi:predicted membrane chloride channel (bestrophin family)
MKRAAIMSDLINRETPKTRNTNTKLAPNSVEKTVLSNIKGFVKNAKLKRSNEARRALATVIASISNENLQENVKTSLAKKN